MDVWAHYWLLLDHLDLTLDVFLGCKVSCYAARCMDMAKGSACLFDVLTKLFAELVVEYRILSPVSAATETNISHTIATFFHAEN